CKRGNQLHVFVHCGQGVEHVCRNVAVRICELEMRVEARRRRTDTNPQHLLLSNSTPGKQRRTQQASEKWGSKSHGKLLPMATSPSHTSLFYQTNMISPCQA